MAGLSPQRADIIVAGPGDHRADHAAAARECGAGAHPRRARRAAADDGAAVAGAARPCRPRIAARPSRSSPRIAASICRTRGRWRASPARCGSSWPRRSGLKAEDRELIESAALIANVGYLINFEGHHKHSYHLIVNSELPGFERRQLQILANVARYHRGSAPKKKHENFASCRWRISSACARWRRSCGWRWRSIARISSTWPKCGPACATTACGSSFKSQGDADVDLWAAERKVDLFEKVFGRKVRFFARSANRPRVRRRVRSSSKRSR